MGFIFLNVFKRIYCQNYPITLLAPNFTSIEINFSINDLIYKINTLMIFNFMYTYLTTNWRQYCTRTLPKMMLILLPYFILGISRFIAKIILFFVRTQTLKPSHMVLQLFGRGTRDTRLIIYIDNR